MQTHLSISVRKKIVQAQLDYTTLLLTWEAHGIGKEGFSSKRTFYQSLSLVEKLIVDLYEELDSLEPTASSSSSEKAYWVYNLNYSVHVLGMK